MALAGHLHQAKLGDGQDVGLGPVPAEQLLHALIDLLLVFAALHVDEVEDDQAADVAQAQLAADFIRRLEIDPQDGRVLVLAAGFVAAGVDVDGHQGLGFVDDDVAAALEEDLPAEGGLQLAGDVEAVEDGLGLGVELDLGARCAC